MAEDNTVYIGSKPTNSYCLAVLTQANEYDEIFIKARGRAISKAVDVAEISVNKYLKGFEVGEVKTGTEERKFKPKKGEFTDYADAPKTINVSTISIKLLKG